MKCIINVVFFAFIGEVTKFPVADSYFVPGCYTGYGINFSASDPNYAPLITNCILWDEEDENEPLMGCLATYSCLIDVDDIGDPNVTYNISDDPLFFDLEEGDYRLERTSSCVNTGDPNQVYAGENLL